MKERLNDQKIPVPEGLEQRLSALVDRLEAEERSKRKVRLMCYAFAVAAVFVAVAFLLIVPEVRERRELARYEGSYAVVNGQRIDDLGRIRADISEALAMARLAEANVPAGDIVSEAERAMLQATDDPEMRAAVQWILR